MTRHIDPEFTMARIDAMGIPCPYCHADADRECYDPATGYVLQNQPAHVRRLQEVGVL